MKIISDKKEQKYFLFLIVLTLILYQGYCYSSLNPTITKYLLLFAGLGLFLYTIKLIIRGNINIPLYTNVRWLVLSMIISVVTCWLMNNQNPLLTVTMMLRGALLIIFFFFLVKTRPSIVILEKYIFFFAIVFCLIWLYAISKAPEVVFGFKEDMELDDSRGIFRLSLVGKGSLILAFFLSLNRYVVQKKYIWLACSIIFFVFIVLQVTRQLILWTFLVAVIYYFKNNIRRGIVFTILGFALFHFSVVTISENSILGALITHSEKQVERQESGTEDVRISEYKYFFEEWNTNPVTVILGGGAPHGASNYGTKYDWIRMYKGFFMSDVGYAGMYAQFGLLGLVCFILLYFKASFSKVSEDLYYAKLFFWFLIPANIAAGWYNMPDFATMTAICLYLIIFGNRISRSS